MLLTELVIGMTVYYIEDINKAPKMAVIKAISPAPSNPNVKYLQLLDGSPNGICKMPNDVFISYDECEKEMLFIRGTGNFEINQYVWIKPVYNTHPMHTVIRSFHIDSSTGETYASLDEIGYICNINRKLNELYLTIKDCEDAIKVCNQNEYEAYKTDININVQTVEDLVKFMWKHPREHISANGLKAIKEKAKEFSIELE